MTFYGFIHNLFSITISNFKKIIFVNEKATSMTKGFSIKDRLKSFVYAAKGIKYTLLTEHNFRIHIVMALIAILLGYVLKISSLEWVSIIIVIGMVFAAEIFNSSIEELTDLVSPDKNQIAGITKDLSAGAVLILAITAFIVGIIIFLPKIIELL